MRKGLWSPDEDEKLRSCIAQHRSGSWSDIARKAGLQRCGKSCRRRWMNHLRPDLKHEKFTVEEVKLVTKLHETLGNKWSEIATYLVGRTDNDVKNLWNTQIKKQFKNAHHDDSISKSTIKLCDGFLFGMDSSAEQMEHSYLEMRQQSLATSSGKIGHLIANPLSSLAENSLEVNLQNKFEGLKQEHDLVSKHISQFYMPKYDPRSDPHTETLSQYVRLEEEPFCCLLDECNILDSKGGDLDTKVNKCTSQSLPSDNRHKNCSYMHTESDVMQHLSDSNLSISYSSWEGARSSNSSAGTINVGDDTSSVCKPSLYEFQYQLQCQQDLENHDKNQQLKDDENDVMSSLSKRESWSSTSCEQWALETLMGYCDAYPRTTWP